MLPRKGSASYRTVHPLPALGSPSHGGGGFSTGGTKRSSRVELLAAVLGWAHSLGVIVLGSCLLLSLAPSWREWGNSSSSSGGNSTTVSVAGSGSLSSSSTSSSSSSSSSDRWWLESPTSFGQSLLFLMSMSYFLADTAALWWRGRFGSSKGRRVLLHHLLSVLGLGACIWTGRDGPLVLVSLVLAEVSSPPLHMLQLARYACKASWRARCVPGAQEWPWLRWALRPLLSACLSMDLTLLHVLIFLLTRLMALQFTAHAVMPFAALLCTKLVATCLLLLSALMFLDMLPALQGDTHEGSLWRQVTSDLREMMSDCSSDGAAAAYADEAPEYSRRRQTAHRTSGPNSPHKSAAPSDADAAGTGSKRGSDASASASAKKKLFWT